MQVATGDNKEIYIHTCILATCIDGAFIYIYIYKIIQDRVK